MFLACPFMQVGAVQKQHYPLLRPHNPSCLQATCDTTTNCMGDCVACDPDSDQCVPSNDDETCTLADESEGACNAGECKVTGATTCLSLFS